MTYNRQPVDDAIDDTGAAARHILGRIGCWIPAGCAALIALIVIGTAGHFALGWFNTAVGVVSPENVKAQWQFAYDYEKALDALARQHCSAVAAATAETDPQAKTQRVTQAQQIAFLYSTREGEFDARLADAFRARLVAPSDVPHTAPTLEAAEARVCASPPPTAP